MRPRPKCPEAKAEARGYEAEAEAKILASRPVWPRGFNISDINSFFLVERDVIKFSIDYREVYKWA